MEATVMENQFASVDESLGTQAWTGFGVVVDDHIISYHSIA